MQEQHREFDFEAFSPKEPAVLEPAAAPEEASALVLAEASAVGESAAVAVVDAGAAAAAAEVPLSAPALAQDD